MTETNVIPLIQPVTFAEFWTDHYPHPKHRGSKKRARELWDRVDWNRWTVENLCDGAKHYRAHLADPEYEWQKPMQLTKWLAGVEWEAWLDVVADAAATTNKVREGKRLATKEERAAWFKAGFNEPDYVVIADPVPEFVRDRVR